MRLKIAHNAKRGIIYGMISKVVSLLLPFFAQNIMINALGSEYLGVKGLFTSILQVFSLAELGFGSAIVYSMYKPIADGNEKLINALLRLFRKIYFFVGLIILFLGLVLIPFLPLLIHGECPSDLNLTVIYLLYLANTVLSYWLFAYRSSLFSAYQRFDVSSIVYTITAILTNVFQIIVLLVFKNFYFYLVISVIFTVINNLILYYSSKKMFPNLNPDGIVDDDTKKEIKEKLKGIWVYKVCGVTRNAFDNIFVSMFLGLKVTAMYSNYFYILSAVSGFLSIIIASLVAGVGNSIKLNSPEKNRCDLEKVDCVYTVISGWCMTCMIGLYQPFIELWVGKDLQFPFPIAILFGVYFYLLQIGNIRSLYADAAGLWWENRYRTIAEAIANIVLNLLFVMWWGVYGVIAATMITIVFGFIYAAKIIYRCYFKDGLKTYFVQHIILAISSGIVCFITVFIGNLFTGNVWEVILTRLLVCCIIAPCLYFLVIISYRKCRESFVWVLKKLFNR